MFSLNLDPDWILAYRTDTLTTIFKVFPYLARNYFFFAIIALGYWLRPQKKVFADLAILVPLTTILNYFLKNLFAIPRPPADLHLIPVGESYGFPSGDSMLAMVFWGMIFLSTQSRLLRLFCFTYVGCIMASRVYLGVHSVYDVFGGAFFGLLLVFLSIGSHARESISERVVGAPFLFWSSYFLIFMSILESTGISCPPMLLMSLGAFFGYGLSLSQMGKNLHQPEKEEVSSLSAWDFIHQVSLAKWISIAFSALLIGLIAICIPLSENPQIFIITEILKYALIVYLIFSVLPRLQRWCVG